MMTDDTYTIRSGSLSATVKAQGAEMCSLKSDAGVEFVWQAEPAWPRHARLLFPIVGRLANDELRHKGKTYRMTQHGFARSASTRSANCCRCRPATFWRRARTFPRSATSVSRRRRPLRTASAVSSSGIAGITASDFRGRRHLARRLGRPSCGGSCAFGCRRPCQRARTVVIRPPNPF